MVLKKIFWVLECIKKWVIYFLLLLLVSLKTNPQCLRQLKTDLCKALKNFLRVSQNDISLWSWHNHPSPQSRTINIFKVWLWSWHTSMYGWEWYMGMQIKNYILWWSIILKMTGAQWASFGQYSISLTLPFFSIFE